ncbi:MAG: sigma-70 family RNA polymerase sigma factor, partial [Pirellulales bacterium]|nr:sigma-70 family RNA polymerase sigma factor [Pirellulales bacterium]
LNKFDPDQGNRFVTYAGWWVRAAMQDYILRYGQSVKAVTTADRKKLFFNLRRIKNEKGVHGLLDEEQQREVAVELDVSVEDVADMDQYLQDGDFALDQAVNSDSDETFMDFLQSEEPTPEEQVAQAEERSLQGEWLKVAMNKVLNEREHYILTERRLSEDPSTLETLSERFGVSRERIRQIENKAFEKVQRAMRDQRTMHASRAVVLDNRS